MAVSDKDILKQFMQTIVPELKAVSGRFADTFAIELSAKKLEVTASPYIDTLWKGRGPTRSGAKKGNPTLQEIILEWIGTKGITPRANDKGKVPTLEQLSWAISKSIHRDGTLLYQRGGKQNIFDSIITQDRINNLLNLISSKYYNEINSINLPRM